MSGGGIEDLSALTFNYTEGADDVWRRSPFHVEGLHSESAAYILDGLAQAQNRPDTSPIGVVVQGERGTGKTHLLGWVRERAQREGGYFVLVGLLDARSFWESVVVSILDSLSRPQHDGQLQLTVLLDRLGIMAGLSRMGRRTITGKRELTKDELDAFITALRRVSGPIGKDSQDSARALVLLAGEDPGLQDLGEAYLSSAPEGEPGERARWGFRPLDRSPQEIVRDLSRLMALTGPTVVAVDQIDPLIAQSRASWSNAATVDPAEKLMIEQIAGGLMALREVTRRTLTVVTCIPATWLMIEQVAVDTVQDRFREAVQLKTIPNAETARNLVATRFEVQYGEAGIKPPYSTWPVRPEAFEQAPGYTPRQLLIRIDKHIHACLLEGKVSELTGFAADPASATVQEPPPAPTPHAQPPVDLGELDARYADLLETVRPPVIDQANEDASMPPLLAAGLFAWIAEQGEPGLAFKVDPPPSAKPPLHARLRRTLDETREDEVHWAFRVVGASHGNAALNRVRKACVAAGLDADVPKRRLFLLRNTPWSPGSATREALDAFERAGGRTLRYSQNDVRILAALRELVAASPPDLAAWLAARRPTTSIGFLTEALATAWTVPPTAGATARPSSATPETPRPTAPPNATAPTSVPAQPYVAVGRRFADGEPVTVALEALRKHTAIFAGSGSGKTVLIRRLVEECALRGVSSIVLDPNNDLARLGEPWPERPPNWEDGDDRRAREYLEGTEVTIWTPGRTGGRPLAFQPLPDLASLAGDPDEFAEAVEAAVAFVVPRLRLEARTAKADRGQAVLRKALAAYGRSGATSLRGLAAYLSDLPDGVSELAGAPRIAADLAQSLTAAMDNDPLFGGTGEPVDPALLVTPPPGRRARVSVISLAGLPGLEQRQSFVSRLQMELFVWFKRHPAQDRPLGALFVMDEAQTFAPAAGGASVSTRSTVMLASQARKYGLGLVFATQAPKGLHNQIPGNCATQFFGLLNAPAQIEAAKDMAQAKGGGDVRDISRLGAGEFYVAREGGAFTKARVPMCLTHHPKAPLTTEEVIARSREQGR